MIRLRPENETLFVTALTAPAARPPRSTRPNPSYLALSADNNDEEPEYVAGERAAPLGAVAQVGGELLYHYDFGDWEHRIAVENVIANGFDLVVCAGGARACPPEDCGGPPGTRICAGSWPTRTTTSTRA